MEETVLSRELMLAYREIEACLENGKILKSVEAFYASMGSQIDVFHEPLLLSDAKRFEQMISHPIDALGEPIHWNRLSSFELYSQKLQKTMEMLTAKNKCVLKRSLFSIVDRFLKERQSQLEDCVQKLKSSEERFEKAHWEMAVASMEKIFHAIEATIGKETEIWRQHWDQELRNLLDQKMTFVLPSLFDHFPKANSFAFDWLNLAFRWT